MPNPAPAFGMLLIVPRSVPGTRLRAGDAVAVRASGAATVTRRDIAGHVDSFQLSKAEAVQAGAYLTAQLFHGATE